MANNYYNFPVDFVPGAKVRSDQINSEYSSIEAAFDLLPTASDAINRGTMSFVGSSTGTGNAYEVAMPATRLSNQDGDQVIFKADKTNTAAATLKIDALSAVALVDWDGTALTGGEIVSGQVYECWYDNANSHFRISAGTDAAVKVTYAEEWSSKAEDSPVSVAAGGNGVNEYSALHWAEKARLNAVDLSALRWEQKTADYTMVNGDRVSVEATSGTATIRPPTTLVLGDFFQVHNETTSTQTVLISPQSGQTIRGPYSTVVNPDTLTVEPGETAFLVASSTTELELV
jgi:hypothetical protein